MADRRVLFLADVRFPLERANGVQVVKTAAALARAGMPTRLVVRRSDERSTEEILELYALPPDKNLDVRRLRVGHRHGSFAWSRASFLLLASAMARARRRGDVVFTRDLQLSDLLLRVGAETRGPLLYEAHAVETLLYRERAALYGTREPVSPRKMGRLFRRESRVWRRASGFVCTTAGIRETFAETYGDRAATRVIPNGCDIAAERSFPGLASDPPARVLYAGQLYPWKGVDVLVQAMIDHPQARLVILGGLEGEPDLTRVRALVRASGIEERTEMPGTIPHAHVKEELRRASVVVVPFLRTAMTERHTSPLKAFEAMAAGRPLVVSDLPSSREFLRHEQNALLVAPGDRGALSKAVGRLLTDRALAERLARAAFNEAARYSWDARARAILAFIEELA